ncbi:MAG: 3-dehydroquinate synthase [Holdemanella sp.]|nr:3-dehydroquinate synthase [Holdemanella sp.]
MKLIVDLKDKSYPIIIQRNSLTHITDTINVDRKVMLIADSGVPDKWIDIVYNQCPDAYIIRFNQGEQSKNIDTYAYLLQACIDKGMTRKDAIIAIGGGVTGDLSGFVAACYMRGIDFYNIPTTTLAQVDSSVGGKVAIDMGDYKNIVGAFWQPKAVVIDNNVLSTLPLRHQHNGLVEALKMGLILEESLIEEFEKDELNIDQIVYRSIDLKRQIVEQDEKENNLRKILNFGHTIGHAIEGAYGLNTYLHGECVAMGMLFFIEDKHLKMRIQKIYERLELPSIPAYDTDTLLNFIMHDKKGAASSVSIIKVKKAGSYEIVDMSYEDIRNVLERGPYEE